MILVGSPVGAAFHPSRQGVCSPCSVFVLTVLEARSELGLEVMGHCPADGGPASVSWGL